MSRDEVKARAGLLAASLVLAWLADHASVGLFVMGVAISAIVLFIAAWVPWDL